ncbi:cobyrinate a,c-diamide synthase [Halalkalibacter alkalisediminis]|uniref:Cobyrinate a,c-diamide synthase n=1 Tax=Halalkalibacter alkalisediminis TaxID=935616 RepID=A0ABV6NBK4_9BACI|nr:cobyrinate a,c-diamide synthase [Halalkalibacter alkalisediminis]
MQPRIIVSGTASGVGKTTATLGLMAALTKQKKVVQGFKCGPDYLDPTFHFAITNRKSHQLDSWMLSEKWIKTIFYKNSEEADLSIIEGMMGLFDGHSASSNVGSTYEISQILDTPVLLVVDISHCARSAAAIVRGFQLMEDKVNIAGVILNKAGSEGHAKLCQEAIEQMCGVPVVGYLKSNDVPVLPERHLGLVPSLEQGQHDLLIETLARAVSNQFDLAKILEIAEGAVRIQEDMDALPWPVQSKQIRIAVAYDAAFHFYYEENFSLLKKAGAELILFSPLAGESLPVDCDGVYLGGGFPEEYVEPLMKNKKLIADLQEASKAGMPILAECGGFMFLAKEIHVHGKAYSMADVIPMEVTMQEKLSAIGYREVETVSETVFGKKGALIRGHEFHYSTSRFMESVQPAFSYKTLNGERQHVGFQANGVLASYIHLHLASNPELALTWMDTCRQYQTKGRKENDD